MSETEIFKGGSRGRKIGAAGTLVFGLGWALYVFGFDKLGPIFLVLGLLMAFAGVVVNFRELKRELMTSREVRFPHPRQPWEK